MLVVSLVVGTLAVARLTRLLVEDRIMTWYRQRIVKKWGPASSIAYLAHCPWCTSIWVSIPVMPVAVLWPNRYVVGVLSILAASYVVGLLNRLEGE